MGHNDFEVWKGVSSGCLVFFHVSEAMYLLVSSTLPTYMNYPMSEKKKCSKLLQMEEVGILLFSVCVGHWFLQPTGFSLRDHHGRRYFTHLIPASNEQKDTVAFAYGSSVSVQKGLWPVRENKTSLVCRQYRRDGEIWRFCWRKE